MTNEDTDFETWFDILKLQVLDRTGVSFRDRSTARDDFDQGRNVHDVIEEIVLEYGPCDED